jgi:23S rRNA (guanosine2251-2'-O)-methyltransferase
MDASEEIIFGKHAVVSFLKQALEPGSRNNLVSRVLLMQTSKPDSAVTQICDLAKALKIKVSTISRNEFEQKVGTDRTHQGVALILGTTPILQMQDFMDLLSRSDGNDQLMVVLLDGIEDPHNLGAIIRVAEASGALAQWLKPVLEHRQFCL